MASTATRSSWSRPAAAILLAAAGLIQLPGCLGERCSAGQILAQGQCVPIADEAGAVDSGPDTGAADAARSDADANTDAVTADGSTSNLGQLCKDDVDCKGGEAEFCVVPPGKKGYCSIKDCTLKPDSCPAGYGCVDLSVFVPGLPNVCLKT